MQFSANCESTVEKVIERTSLIETDRILYNVNRFKKAARVLLPTNKHDTGGDHVAVYTSLPGTTGRKLIKDFFKLELSLNQNIGFKAGQGLAYHNLGCSF